MHTTGQTVLITGGSSGIGLAFAKKFLQHDNRVIITGRDLTKLVAVQHAYPAIEIVQADMQDTKVLQQLAQEYPHTTVLVNNAGIQLNYDIADAAIPLARIGEEIGVNLVGPLAFTKVMLPHLLAHPAAAVVNISSSLAWMPKQSAPVYSATKAALHQFTRALRWQLESTSVRVFEVIPPLVDTAMTAGRGTRKISPDAVADAFWHAFQHNHTEVVVGGARLLLALHRLFPPLAEQILRYG
jgi:uncharacterized oxidoreductase